MNNPTEILQARYEMARKRIQDADARGLSQSTVNKRWREFFKIEDEAKRAGCL